LKILALGAHPDDIENGCGATLSKMVRTKEAEVTARVFTQCRDAVPKGWSENTLLNEFALAMKVLGVTDASAYDYDNKALYDDRQAILDILYAVQDDFDLVFCPSSFNSNQDHRTVFSEARRAFRGTSILGYTTPSSDYGFAQAAIYSVFTPYDLEIKVKALRCYKSQFELKRPYFGDEYTRSLASVTGTECWHPLAEKFENIRFVMR